MEKNTRLAICTENRIGITEDILRELHNLEIDLISMEVHTKRISLMVAPLSMVEKNLLFEKLLSIQDVYSIEELKLLDFERAERSLMAMINAVDEGILALDLENRISLFNPYCEELFGISQEAVIGESVEKLLGESSPIARLIKEGISYDNSEWAFQYDGIEIQYVSTGRLIKDDEEAVIGAVASIKDVNKVKELMEVISVAEEDPFSELIGDSQVIRNAKRTARAVSHSHATVMIRGESGTGKELFAKAIHKLSQRHGPFVTINCAAIPESLLESELFGYEKGSFTGALSSKKGLFEEADGGTLFLDEVGELPLSTQAKLLRVIQDSAVRRIGSNSEKKVDVRILVATHRNLEDMKRDKIFREDLYYRLNVIPIHIPSLKERREDIALLASHFINKASKRLGRGNITVLGEFFEALTAYSWPGNVRELQNVIERAVTLCETNQLSLKDLHIFESTSIEGSHNGLNALNQIKVNSGCNLALQGEVSECSIVAFVNAMRSLKNGSLKTQGLLEAYVGEFEKRIILSTMREDISYRTAAKALGISHTTIMNKIEKYNLRNCK